MHAEKSDARPAVAEERETGWTCGDGSTRVVPVSTEPPTNPWPLRHLVLRTPGLELRPEDDDGLLELVELARTGIHPPEQMPFLHPWTDAPADDLGPNTMRYFWGLRARNVPDDWSVTFLVRESGALVGVQELQATSFTTVREVRSGSWLGLAHQGRGLGTEMRAAVVTFALDHLGATAARSEAFHDNTASLRVSEKLGYLPDGTTARARRGQRVLEQRLLLTAGSFRRPGWELHVENLNACRHQLGAPAEPSSVGG